MRYKYENNIVSFELFGFNVEAANIGGREWRLAIVEQPGSVLNKFIKTDEFEYADFGEVPGTTMFWHFDKAPTLREVINTIREYKQNKEEHNAFMQLIGAKA